MIPGQVHRLVAAALALLLGACAGRKGNQEEVPRSASASLLELPGLLGRPFHLVKEGGARTLPPREKTLLEGFGLTVQEVRQQSGEPIAITTSGLRVRLRDLEPPVLSPFEGAEIHDGQLKLGWVIRKAAPVLAAPATAAKIIGRRARLARVALTDAAGPAGYYRTNAGWMKETDLAIPRRAARPGEVGPDQLWIEIALGSQTLVAYRGDRPIFATLISGGVGAPGSPFATPIGTHRIGGKRLLTPMSNLEHRGVPAYYFYEEVPLAQFIGRVALHGVYWHDGFGQPRSHGCINLALRDALRLFGLTQPTLPAGSSEVTAEGRGGTVVRVR